MPFYLKPGKHNQDKSPDDIIDINNNIASFELEGDARKGGSIPGMFAIPMGIYNRYKDAKDAFKQRQIEQQQIKLKKQGFNSLEDKIKSLKSEISEAKNLIK